MTWWQISALAREGLPVRRKVWPEAKTLFFTAGGGTTRALAVISTISVTPTSQETVLAVVKSTEFGKAEFEAGDWEVA